MTARRRNRCKWSRVMILAALLLACVTVSITGQEEQISVTLWIHSGRPNPQWTIQQGAELERFIALVQALDVSTEPVFDYSEWNRMGYASFWVDLRNSQAADVAPSAIHVWREMAVLLDARGAIIGYAVSADGLYDTLVAQAEERSLSAFFNDYSAYQERRFPYYQIAGNIYESLVDLDPQANARPELASGWEVSSDGLRVTFHLREGVMMHDGTPVTAGVVVYNFEHEVELLAGFTRSPLLSLSMIDAIEVLDALTIQLVLNRVPDQAFWFGLSGWTGMIGPIGGLEDVPIGSGPFRYATAEDESLVLVPYDMHWAGRPQVSALVYRAIPDQEQRLEMLAGGELDAIVGVGLARFDRALWAGLTICGSPERFVAVDEALVGFQCYPDSVMRFDRIVRDHEIVVGMPSFGEP